MKINSDLKSKTAIFTICNDEGSINVINDSFLNALSSEIANLQELYREDLVNSLIITGTNENGFLAGISPEILRNTDSKEDFLNLCNKTQNIFSALRNMPFPVIAAINGNCVSGGFELALACQYRIFVNNRNCEIGLPDFAMGLIPGLSGSSRLPRLIGLNKAIRMVCHGKTFLPAEALKYGIVDEIVPQERLIDIARNAVKNWDDKLEYRKEFLRKVHKGNWFKLFMRTYPGIFLTKRYYEGRLSVKNDADWSAGLKALDILVDASIKQPEAVFKAEREGFADLLLKSTPEPYAKNYIESKFIQDELKSKIKVDFDVKKPKKIAICGAGKIGAELAYFFASHKVYVRLIDQNEQLLSTAMKNAKRLAEKLADSGRINKFEVRRILDNINPGEEFTGFQNAEFVIEAVNGTLKEKRKTIAQIEKIVSSETLLLSCSNSLQAEKLAKKMTTPQRLVAVNFAYPMLDYPLTEIVQSDLTSEKSLKQTFKLMADFERVPIVAKDVVGFLLNRLKTAYFHEVFWLVLEGIDPKRIDTALEDFGMKKGPCKMLDEMGLKEFRKISKKMLKHCGERLHDSKFIDAMIKKGWTGKESGKGFYNYADQFDSKPRKNLMLNRLSFKVRNVMNLPRSRRKASMDYVIERLLSALVNEASYAFEEGIVENPKELDAIAVFGLGFPAFRGGLLQHAKVYGLPKIVKLLDIWFNCPPELEAVYMEKLSEFKTEQTKENGKRFVVSKLLREIADSKSDFFEQFEQLAAEIEISNDDAEDENDVAEDTNNEVENSEDVDAEKKNEDETENKVVEEESVEPEEAENDDEDDENTKVEN